MKSFLFIGTLLSLFIAPMFGQQLLSLEQRMSNAELVIEGKVIKQTTFLEKDEIYTRNEVEVYKIFKGNYSGKYIFIITQGGVYGENARFCDHCLQFSIGTSGVFLATEKAIRFGQEREYFIKWEGEGFYKYTMQKEKVVAATETDFQSDRTLFHKQLEVLSSQPIEIVALTPTEVALKKWLASQSQQMRDADFCIQYEFKNVQIRFINLQLVIDLDIYAKSLVGVFQLAKSKLAFQYASSVFGNNIVNNQLLTVTKGDAVQTPNYQLSVGDITSDKFYLDIESGITDPTLLEVMGNNPKQLCHLKLQVANVTPQSVIFFNPDLLNTESKYYENGAAEYFECFRNLEPLSGTIASLLSPQITNFSPTTIYAGTYNVQMPNPLSDIRSKSMLTINGTNFGNDKGDVWFTDAVTGPGQGFMKVMRDDILLWTDNLIQVKVPSCGLDLTESSTMGCGEDHYAGTGKIAIVTANNLNVESNDELTVNWATRNIASTVNGKRISVST